MASSSEDSSTSSDSSNTSDSEESSVASTPKAPKTAPSTRPKDPPRARPRISGVNQSFATVLVGKEEAKFVVHEALLCHYSDFFRAALQGGFKEAETRVVKLVDEDASVFEVFVHWLYHQRLPNAQEDDAQLVQLFDAGGEGRRTGREDRRHLRKSEVLVQLYVFGDAHQALQFKTAVLKSLFEHLHSGSRCSPWIITTTYAFTKLSDNDPLCRLLVDFYCFRVRDVIFKGVDYHPEFLIQVAKRWVRLAYGKPRIFLRKYKLLLRDYVQKEGD